MQSPDFAGANGPSFVLDSMLLMRQLRPESLLRPFGIVVAGDSDDQLQAQTLIERERGVPSASLEWIATSLGLPAPDVGYQQPATWCVSTLTKHHHDYAAANADLPLHIVKFLMPGIDVLGMAGVIEQKYPWYIPYAKATIRLAEAHVRGVPFDAAASESLRAECLANILRTSGELARIPEFAPLYKQLIDTKTGDTSELKNACERYMAANATALSQSEAGLITTTQKAERSSGANKLPAWKLIEEIKNNKSMIRFVEQYQQAALADGRMHSLVTFAAATGRSTSTAPSLQNIPRDPRFRALIKARPGHLILAADYGAIELRIAAALAERAICDIRERVERVCSDSWFMERVMAGVRAPQQLPGPPEPVKFDIAWLEQAIPAVVQTVLGREAQRMTSIFSRGLDPHLVTALDMAGRQGKVDCRRNPVEWLAFQDSRTQKALKMRFHDERQKAKPANFGLLYGMSADGLYAMGVNDYGLNWSRVEAFRARQAWFALYPEFRLWHWWTSLTQSQPIPNNKCKVWNPHERKLISPEHTAKLYRISTLSGRPFAILNSQRHALNYQDQGSGADILARASALMPEEVAEMMLMPVHDELVLEVPASEVEEVRRIVVETMVRAADEVLGGKIPVEVEVTVGEVWGKA